MLTLLDFKNRQKSKSIFTSEFNTKQTILHFKNYNKIFLTDSNISQNKNDIIKITIFWKNPS